MRDLEAWNGPDVERVTGGCISGKSNDSLAPIRVECERLPASLRAKDSTVCACLGALDTPDLLTLCLQAGPRLVVMVDPGFCATCPEGGVGASPGAAARAEAAELLADMGLASRIPVVERLQSCSRERDDTEAQQRDRRAFFRRLARPGRPAAIPRHDVEAARRAATLAGLKRLAEAFGAPLPAGFFPAIGVSGACRDHGVCAALCPTRALRRYERDGARGIGFDSALCIGCGACESGCPERAIRLQLAGDGRVPAGEVRLTAHELRICERCEDEFAAAEGQALCPSCRKDATLFADPFMVASIGGRRAGDSRSQEV